MSQNLLIVGAGIYGLVVKEIAESTGRFERIAFVDDDPKEVRDGMQIIGTTEDLADLSGEYSNAVVAIGNPAVRQDMLNFIQEKTNLKPATLISPKAYVSPSAVIGDGSIIEPMSVVNTGCVLGRGCLICAGAVVNHAAKCGDCVQVDCNATVAGSAVVPDGVKVAVGTVYEMVISD